MNKDMNKLKKNITKYDIRYGLFIFLFIGLFISKKTAVIYIFGVVIALINFLTSVYTTCKWMGTKNDILFMTTVLRILVVVACIFPFIHNIKLLLAYVSGLVTHSILLICCGVNRKGCD